VDLAGNAASATVSDVNIDLTPPVASLSRSPQPNAAGWNNEAVTVRLTCNDVLSGIDVTDAPTTLSREGTNQTANLSCIDYAGNAQTGAIAGIHIDVTPPVPDLGLDGPSGDGGWWRGAVTIGLGCADLLSGPGEGTLRYRLNEGVLVSYGGDFNVSEEGVTALEAFCEDQAGNDGSRSSSIAIDSRPPTGNLSVPPMAFGPYAVDWSAVDSLPGSGLAQIEVLEQSGLGRDEAWVAVCSEPAAGPEASGTCRRHPDSGLYCYSLRLRDVAGNEAVINRETVAATELGAGCIVSLRLKGFLAA
jgi:hypothetical protein